ncbi:Ras domain-containing protein/Adaptin_binding domain-containing protein [Cephalotus follicularis]|uniref:Ras domain-containing protein/Adaptin_binding domain-containing protein n=1 Tax=Cephalotus follicularis TaxID=3775 RepID=A0A1Q3D124_CEPFO|nr:Ras domain-containing protein/Adaptin_binding domain-containing protein [Cephalotus follicularis]
MQSLDRSSLENRPGIFFIGSPNVGKRTLLSRLLSVNFEDVSESSTETIVQGWTINTKYYTADVSVWMAHLEDGFCISSLPIIDKLAALVMVFDINHLESLAALQAWVSRTDIQRFEILLCIGNKVDLIPGHPVHSEYRRRHLHKIGDNSVDPYADYAEYGISETEGSSLLGDELPSWEIKRSCLEWCSQHNIEYIEACASNAAYDNCLSIDGDSQGVERLYGSLSAHMWPGMILKSGDKIIEPSLREKEESSEEESDYELEYEVLSAGSADLWDDTDDGWVSANGVNKFPNNTECDQENLTRCDKKEELQPSTSMSALQDESDREVTPYPEEHERVIESDEGAHFDFEDLEQLMSEIGNMRAGLRLMPDFQRREMAAKLAMKMATMFGDNTDDEEGI